jgi:hypothetical protein
MAWSAPMTFVANTALTAAQLNQYLRDNMLETAPAKATTAGYHFVTTGPNSIAERAIEGDWIATAETTTETSYTDLNTLGPSVTCVTGTKAIYIMSARMSHSAGGSLRASIEISGASSIEAGDARELTVHIGHNHQNKVGTTYFETGLTPGTNTFTMKYRVQDEGTGTFAERHLIVIAL